MSHEETIENFLNEKLSGKKDRSEIKRELLDMDFSENEANEILKEISQRELHIIQNRPTLLFRITESVYFSYIFIVFAIVAIGISIYILQLETKSTLSKTWPWIIIAGGGFMIFKHWNQIRQKRNN